MVDSRPQRDGWREVSLSNVAQINPAETLKKGSNAKKVNLASIIPFTKKITHFQVDEYKGGAKFRNGDTLVARITPCLENGKTSYVDFLDNGELGVGSTELIVLREREGVTDNNFLYYLATSHGFRDTAIKSMTGASGRQRVQPHELSKYRFWLPPLAEQKRIAARLDAAFAEIDAAIASARREGADFGNLKNAVLKAEFDNGNAENWTIAQLGEVCDISAGNPAPQGDFNFINGKYPFYRTYDVGRAHRSPNLQDVRDWLNEDGIKGLKKFNKGTILFPKSGASTLLNHRAIMGYDGYVSPHLATISPRETKILGLFAYMCLLNVDAKILIAGQDYPSLRIGKIAQIKIPLPPLAEQRRIAARLEEAFEQVEIGLSSVAKRLTEYKALKAALLRSHLNGGAA